MASTAGDILGRLSVGDLGTREDGGSEWTLEILPPGCLLWVFCGRACDAYLLSMYYVPGPVPSQLGYENGVWHLERAEMPTGASTLRQKC